LLIILTGSGYGDDDDDEWGGDDSAWTEEAEPEDEADGKDESSAYLEFLNEEVSSQARLSTSELTPFRHRSSKTSRTTIQMMS